MRSPFLVIPTPRLDDRLAQNASSQGRTAEVGNRGQTSEGRGRGQSPESGALGGFQPFGFDYEAAVNRGKFFCRAVPVGSDPQSRRSSGEERIRQGPAAAPRLPALERLRQPRAPAQPRKGLPGTAAGPPRRHRARLRRGDTRSHLNGVEVEDRRTTPSATMTQTKGLGPFLIPYQASLAWRTDLRLHGP